MKNLGALLIVLAGCYGPESDLDRHIDLAPQGVEPIPYRTSGTFAVKVGVNGKDFESATHATLSIVTSDAVMGATTNTAVVLDRDGGFLLGTGTLVWPPGGKVEVAAEALGVRDIQTIEIEKPSLVLALVTTSNNGAQTTLELCFDSTTADGTAVVRVDGATIKDTTNVEAMVPLAFGTCTATPEPGISSHGRVKLTPTASSVALLATLPNTGFSLERPVPVEAFGPIVLGLQHVPAAPPALSIVTLEITATRTGGQEGIVVALQSSPSLSFLPATATTDATGKATVQFQMPQTGGVVIQARVGSVVENETIP